MADEISESKESGPEIRDLTTFNMGPEYKTVYANSFRLAVTRSDILIDLAVTEPTRQEIQTARVILESKLIMGILIPIGMVDQIIASLKGAQEAYKKSFIDGANKGK